MAGSGNDDSLSAGPGNSDDLRGGSGTGDTLDGGNGGWVDMYAGAALISFLRLVMANPTGCKGGSGSHLSTDRRGADATLLTGSADHEYLEASATVT